MQNAQSAFVQMSVCCMLHGQIHLSKLHVRLGDRGSTVVKVLCDKPEGRWFDPRWCHWKFSLT
jgi:hypothetical protein